MQMIMSCACTALPPIQARITFNMDSSTISLEGSLSDAARTRRRRIEVVIVPLPAQGHLNQLLHLARSLATKGLSVLFAATSSHIHQARRRAQGWNPGDLDIRFEALPMPDIPDLPPDLRSTHNFPIHLIPLFETYESLQAPLDRLLQKIRSSDNQMEGPTSSHRRIAIVHDASLGWVQTVAAKHCVPAYIFRCVGACSSLSLYISLGQEPRNFPEVPIVPVQRCIPQRFIDYISRQRPLHRLAKGVLCNTFFELESKFIDLLREQSGPDRPTWTVGPLLPEPFLKGDDERMELLRSADDCECLRWLDARAPASVVYVSFGTISSLSPEQMRELAVGLERSQQPFLWVLRVADSAIFSENPKTDWIPGVLPEGFEDRVKGRGFIVRNWAPQLHVLAHKATGGFISHCGWNSITESISLGVPMVVWPLHSDQPANAILVARELKVGVEMKEWMYERKDELVKAEEIVRAVRRLMVEDEGAQIRRRAMALRDAARRGTAEEGSSSRELQSFVDHLSSTLDYAENCTCGPESKVIRV